MAYPKPLSLHGANNFAKNARQAINQNLIKECLLAVCNDFETGVEIGVVTYFIQVRKLYKQW